MDLNPRNAMQYLEMDCKWGRSWSFEIYQNKRCACMFWSFLACQIDLMFSFVFKQLATRALNRFKFLSSSACSAKAAILWKINSGPFQTTSNPHRKRLQIHRAIGHRGPPAWSRSSDLPSNKRQRPSTDPAPDLAIFLASSPSRWPFLQVFLVVKKLKNLWKVCASVLYRYFRWNFVILLPLHIQMKLGSNFPS